MSNYTLEPISLAAFACDYCRRKKLKCSRHLPKCSKCAKWSSECNYSHATRKRVTTANKRAAVSFGDVEERLDRIESDIAQMASSMNELGQLLRHNVGSAAAHTHTSHTTTALIDTLEQGYATPYQNPSHAFSPSLFAPAHLESIARQGTTTDQLDGPKSLRELTNSLSSIHFHADPVREDARKAGRSSSLFYVPNLKEGDCLMQRYLDVVKKGRPLYVSPTREDLSEILYEPAKVSERGSVVLFNFLLLYATPALDPPSTALRERLRWNTWIALDDSSLFLEPCVANILALLTIASHGEDFATPNLSWILVGHACRLAQAMNLHLPIVADEVIKKQRVFLFWSLFVIDKSVCLAFGRPCALASAFYENLPVPDHTYFIDFAPHLRPCSEISHGSLRSRFGALFFVQTIILARLRGKVSDYLQSLSMLNQAFSTEVKKALEGELSDWYCETNTFLTSAREDESAKIDDNGKTEMNIALESIFFQYHHLRVLLTRHDNKDRSLCLQSAREAISALDRLVASSERVYNGIIWQLLYYPFTPFFTIFGNIIHDPLALACEKDLELLRSTVTYFIRMASQGAIANKLEKIASVFASLAETHMENAKGQAANRATKGTDAWAQSSRNLNQAARLDDTSSQPIWASSRGAEGSAVLPRPDIAIDDFFNWLSPGDRIPSNLERPPQYQQDLYLDGEGGIGDNSDIFGSPSSRTRKRPLECDFDWISWDIAGMGPISE